MEGDAKQETNSDKLAFHSHVHENVDGGGCEMKKDCDDCIFIGVHCSPDSPEVGRSDCSSFEAETRKNDPEEYITCCPFCGSADLAFGPEWKAVSEDEQAETLTEFICEDCARSHWI